jgi:hypothetical protein
LNIAQYISPWTTQYGCAIFYFILGSGQVNMITDTHAPCVAIALGLCLKKEKHRRWIQEWYKRRPQYTFENLETDNVE